jgi:hypothetical protein
MKIFADAEIFSYNEIKDGFYYMINQMKEDCESLLKHYGAGKIEDVRYAHMKYPKLIPLMDFYVDRYRIDGFGMVMVMHTKTKMGMELLTMSFMPDGMSLPYLLADAMSMKKKRCVFVEYYGCGYEDLNDEKLYEVFEKYRDLEDYEEKPNWYVKERRPYSLIKTGSKEELLAMTHDSLKAYLGSIAGAVYDEDYKRKLMDFRDRMITEGNPSSKTLEMLLKKDGAVRFMEDVVMGFNN